MPPKGSRKGTSGNLYIYIYIFIHPCVGVDIVRAIIGCTTRRTTAIHKSGECFATSAITSFLKKADRSTARDDHPHLSPYLFVVYPIARP